MLCAAQERVGLRLEVLDADPCVGRGDAAQQGLRFRVVAA